MQIRRNGMQNYLKWKSAFQGSSYSPYMHDAMYMYARALNKTLKQDSKQYRNGTKIRENCQMNFTGGYIFTLFPFTIAPFSNNSSNPLLLILHNIASLLGMSGQVIITKDGDRLPNIRFEGFDGNGKREHFGLIRTSEDEANVQVSFWFYYHLYPFQVSSDARAEQSIHTFDNLGVERRSEAPVSSCLWLRRRSLPHLFYGTVLLVGRRSLYHFCANADLGRCIDRL